MGISLIAAIAQNRVIGGNNRMLWHLPSDFAYFKKITMGKPIIMGRKTFDSIGQPLKGRKNIVITHDQNRITNGVIVVDNIESAFGYAENMEDIFIIGGGDIYAQTLHMADTLYITEVDITIEGDTVFPDIDPDTWYKHSVSEDKTENNITYRFVVYKKRV